MSEIIAWYWFVIRWTVRDMWRGLPGPLWVKLLICLLVIVAQVVPGQLDDIALILVIGYIKKHRKVHNV